jgi:C4-dicarboxylate transporter DctM subunit
VEWLLGAVPAVLLCLGAPLYVCFLAGAVAGLVVVVDVPHTVAAQAIFGAADSFTLLAIPFFLFAGDLMGRSGIADRLIRWSLALFGGVRGSLALATVGGSVIFGAISGATVATVATVGRVMYPALRENGYDEEFSLGLITATGSIDALIPPSILMVLYGVAAEQSVARLFIAGIVPGLLLAGVQAAYVVWHARRHRVPVTGRVDVREMARATRRASWALSVPLIILGGIYLGVFTPTEAAGVAVVVGAISGLFVYRDTGWSATWRIAVASGKLTSQLLIIVGCAQLYAWLITTLNVPQRVAEMVTALALPPWGIMMALNVILLVAGMLVDPASATLVLTPLFVPLVKSAGVDLLHFGVILATNLGLGTYTPPFATNIFTTQSLFNAPVAKIVRGLLPFIGLHLLALAAITYVPWFSLVLLRGF